MTFLFCLLLTLFCLGTALVLGGTAAIAIATAPQLHKTLAPRQAGAAFERVLHVFDRMGFAGAWAATLSAAFLAIIYDVGNARWWAEAAILGVVALLYLVLILSVAPRARRLAAPREEGAEDPRSDFEKTEFQRLHRLYVRVYATNLLLATAAFVVLALPF